VHADPQRVERDAELGGERLAPAAAVVVGALVRQQAPASELRELVEAPAQPCERVVGVVRPRCRGRGQGGQRDRLLAAGAARRIADLARDLAQGGADVARAAGQRARDTVEHLVGEVLGIGQRATAIQRDQADPEPLVARRRLRHIRIERAEKLVPGIASERAIRHPPSHPRSAGDFCNARITARALGLPGAGRRWSSGIATGRGGLQIAALGRCRGTSLPG
jgi:hypothetical protein